MYVSTYVETCNKQQSPMYLTWRGGGIPRREGMVTRNVTISISSTMYLPPREEKSHSNLPPHFSARSAATATLTALSRRFYPAQVRRLPAAGMAGRTSMATSRRSTGVRDITVSASRTSHTSKTMTASRAISTSAQRASRRWEGDCMFFLFFLFRRELSRLADGERESVCVCVCARVCVRESERE